MSHIAPCPRTKKRTSKQNETNFANDNCWPNLEAESKVKQLWHNTVAKEGWQKGEDGVNPP